MPINRDHTGIRDQNSWDNAFVDEDPAGENAVGTKDARLPNYDSAPLESQPQHEKCYLSA